MISRPPLWLLCTVLLLLAYALFGSLSVLELRAAEPRRAGVALEMMLSGDYWTPKLNGWTYFNKPPFFAWVQATFFHLFGTSEWVARLPGVLSFCLTALLIFGAARRCVSNKVGLLAGLFLLTSVDLLLYGSVNSGEIDLFFSLLIVAQSLTVFHFFERKQWLALFVVSWLLAAIGFLTKGPSVVFQLLTLGVWFIYNREWKRLFGWQHLVGVSVFVGLVWGYFFQYNQTGDAAGFLAHLVGEGAEKTAANSSWTDLLLVVLRFPLTLLVLLAPWSLLGLFGFRKGVWKLVKGNRLVLFSVLFVLINIPLYWFNPELRNRYIYMFLPFLCLVLAWFAEQQAANFPKLHRAVDWILGGAMVLVIPAVCVPLFLPETENISGIYWKVAVLTALAALVIAAFVKLKSHRLLMVVAMLAVVRIGYNWFYLEATQQNSKSTVYREHMANILSIAGDEPIFFTGHTRQLHAALSIAGVAVIPERTLESAPLIPYQVPYYLTRTNGHIMAFHPIPEPGKLYIAEADFLTGKPHDEYYRFNGFWLPKEWVVCRFR